MSVRFDLLDLASLSQENKALFKTLLFPKDSPQHRELFLKETESLSIAAFSDQEPIGLISGFLYKTIREALIATYFVKEAWRGKGVGKKLLELFLEEVKKQNIHIASIDYIKTISAPSPLEEILKALHAESQEEVLRRYFFDPKQFTPPWYQNSTLSLPKHYRIAPWIGVVKKEEATLNAFKRRFPVISLLDPREMAFPIDFRTSFALLYKNRLVGWIVTCKKNKEELTYSSFFALPEQRNTSAPIILLKTAIHAHFSRSMNELGVIEINNRLDPSWQKFVKKRLAPYSTKQESLVRSYFIV